MSGASFFTTFTEDQCPPWTCPGCINTTLKMVPESFYYSKTASTIAHEKDEWFDYDNVSYVFCCQLKCELAGCLESVALTGIGWIDLEPSYDDQGNMRADYIRTFQAKTFYPALPLFIPPEGCPETVLTELYEISALLNSHPSAAANAIRRLLETLLDKMKVPREIPREGKAPAVLRLHARIERFPEILGEHQRGVMALKYLGNTGSHEIREIERQNLEDACQILENIIQQLYQRKPDLSMQIERLELAHKPK